MIISRERKEDCGQGCQPTAHTWREVYREGRSGVGSHFLPRAEGGETVVLLDKCLKVSKFCFVLVIARLISFGFVVLLYDCILRGNK